MFLVVDNRDSFTWTIVDYLRTLGAGVAVARSDALTPAEALDRGRGGVVISPGPGRPEDAGISLPLVAACVEARRPLLGLCLGHQAIVHALGGRIERGPAPVHGKAGPIHHDRSGLFAGLPSPMTAVRYNSLVATGVPDGLIVNARADDGSVQGVRHRTLPIHGFQFHPESIASERGHDLFAAFLRLAGRDA